MQNELDKRWPSLESHRESCRSTCFRWQKGCCVTGAWRVGAVVSLVEVHPLQDVGEQVLPSCYLSCSRFWIKSSFLGFCVYVCVNAFTNITFGDCCEADSSFAFLATQIQSDFTKR